MKNRMTSRDYELISAYLDNQLGSKERAQFEARLKTDPMLQKELHEIGKTRLLVRSMPKLRAPRNYFVRAEAASKVRARPLPVRPSLRLAPAMGIVSALATILLVLVIFGDKLLTTSGPVALAPAPVVPQETLVIQEQAQSKAAPTEAPSESAPMMLAAPALASPSPPGGELRIGETGLPTPTTIYIYALPPSSTPFNPEAFYVPQTENAILGCEDYLAGGGYPTQPGLICPTPTGTQSYFLESLPASSTLTPTSTLPPNLANVLPTSTPTPTATPTSTSTPTATPSPSPTPSATPTETPLPTVNVAPTEGAALSTGLTAQSQDTGGVNPTPEGAQPAAATGTTPNVVFMRYILLAVEVSLAVIAVVAGIIAIILRVRAGR